MNEKKIELFLSDLLELTKKHRIYIQGCGCCGSPYLFELEKNEAALHYSVDDKEENLILTHKRRKKNV